MSARRELAELAAGVRRAARGSPDKAGGTDLNAPRTMKTTTTISKKKTVEAAAPQIARAMPPLPPRRSPDPKVVAALAAMAEEVKACRKCPLGGTRLNAAFGVGHTAADVMFVGEGPGFEEDHRGEPFVGRAGKLLDQIIASIGLDRTIVYIANVVKCHPMIRPHEPESRGNDRPPTPEEMAACRSYLERQIELIKPSVIVTLGATAVKGLLRTTQGISTLRGRWQELSLGSETYPLLPTYHPAALLRNPTLKRDVWNDMKALRKFLEEAR